LIFLKNKNRCTRCEDLAEKEYKALIQEVYSDGLVEPRERRELKDKATVLNIDSGKALDLEKPFREEATKPLGKFHQMQLEEAKRLLLEELDSFGCWESLKPVFDAHRNRDDAVGEEVRYFYLLCNIENDPSAALKFTQETLDEYDDPHSYYIHMEYYERKGDREGVKRAIGLAESKFQDHACVQGAIMKHCLDQYLITGSKACMTAAQDAYDGIEAGLKESFIPSLKAYYIYLGHKDREAFQREKEKVATPESHFFINKILAQLNASKLILEVNGVAYECNHGDVLGRKGDVAKSHLASVPHIHGKHAEVFCSFGQWYIRALSNTQNPTYVDEYLVEPGGHHKITGEHRLRLSTKFEAKIKLQPVSPNDRF